MHTPSERGESPFLQTRRTATRFLVLACLCSLTFILYLDRVCIAQAATSIQEDLGLSSTQMGFVFGAFTVAYSLFEVVTGHWGDRFGARSILTRIVLWWSAFTVLTGCVMRFEWFPLGSVPSQSAMTWFGINSFTALLAVRFLFGAGEAGALPNAARVVMHWFPLAEKGFVLGLMLLCMQLGGALAPWLAAQLIAVFGWRWTFACFGALGVIWCALFYAWFRDDPATHSQVSASELYFIEQGRAAQPEHMSQHIPWGQLLASPTLWLMGAIQTCSSFTTYLIMAWYPTYLKQGHGLSEGDAGLCTTLVLACGAAGSFFGGFLSRQGDRCSNPGLWRRCSGGLGLMSAAACIALAPHCESVQLTTALMALSNFLTISQQANWWTVMTTIGGRHVGALFGFANGLGGIGGFTSPVFMGWFVDQQRLLGITGRMQWDPAFPVYAMVMFVGGLCWLGINSTRPIVTHR